MSEKQALAEFGQMLPHADPPPAAVIAAAHAALGDRTPGADIAALMFDSVFDDDVVPRALGEPRTRVLLFACAGLAVMIGARRLPEGTEITGRYIGSTGFDVWLRLPGTGMVELEQPVAGGFEREAIPQTTISLVLFSRPPGRPRTVVTDPVVV